MDLTKVNNEQKLFYCKRYFLLGILALPFLWAINTVWFYAEAFRKPPYAQQKQIKKYVILSAIGTSVWTVGLVAWVAVFQINRSSWGAFGDNLSFVIPTGRA